MQTDLQNYLDKKRGEVLGARGRARLDISGLELAAICDALETVTLIDMLRAEEGHEVTICHDNPDFGGPNCAVVWSNDYGVDHSAKSFFGETVLEALHMALSAKTGEPPPPPPPPEDRDHFWGGAPGAVSLCAVIVAIALIIASDPQAYMHGLLAFFRLN